jgi:CelD/BcsL family acetyltransferase involved in cellulose biosynthesis
MPADRETDGNVRLERIERLEDLRDDWERLAEATAHPFATFEWNSEWWRRFGAGRELYSFACRDAAGTVVAILPLYVGLTRPLRVARFLGYGDLASPLCAPADRPLAARALQAALRTPDGRCRLLLAERLPGGEGWGELLGGRLLRRHHDPVLRFEGLGWDEWLAARSKNFREQVRRRERKIVRELGLSFRLADDPDRLDADMDALFRLHAERWKGETTGVFASPGDDFHRAFARAALERGWLRLWLAEVDGETVAAWYGWRYAGSEWYYQAGRVDRYEQLSLGFVVLAHTVREACDDGVASYRFLAGDEPYKARFTSDDLGAESRTIAAGPLSSAAGLALKGVLAARS